ncbi:MAG: selenocysteine-specific translation elongation factor [Planctomycetota bacterium]|nr:MAG: selenocysteine-specific translation elongation factor [Planctomycetota bacterium]
MSEVQPLPVVVGTAGHIDHGKSALVEALTGTHPDRWEEERRRGITLDLGYAQLSWPDGLEIGFVDVPGHERLVRKMVAGATGMGAALLVVACDDGVMPQTREHFEVLRLLGIDHGLVALSKCDLADAETRELVRAEVEELLADTPWEGRPMIEVSALTGEGIEELRSALRETALAARREADPHPAFRLPVQRVFALHGAGTVVTGVTAAGVLREGEAVEVLPAGVRSRVRRVQVHGRQAGLARPGLRTALNLPDLDPDLAGRGSVVAAPGSLRCGRLLRAIVSPLPAAPELEHGAGIQLLAGTAAIPGRVFLAPERPAADLLLVDLLLAEPAALAPGERLILRRPSPARNLASGRFLAFADRRLRRRDQDERQALLALAEALDRPAELAVRALERLGGAQEPAAVAAFLGWTRDAALRELEAAAARGEVREVSGGRYLAAGRAGELAREILAAVAAWRQRAPHRARIPITELRERLGRKRARILNELTDAELELVGLRRRPGTAWDLLEAEPPPPVAAAAELVLGRLAEAGLSAPSAAELAEELELQPARVEQALEYLADRGRVIRPAGGRAYATAAVEELRAALVEQFGAGGPDIPALRDRFRTSRKYLMPLLEFLDERGVTARRGPNRILVDPRAPLV